MAAGPTQPLAIISHSGRHEFKVEVADEPRQRARGLMFRAELAPDTGMLFDFGQTAPVHMWMKNTYISLDMLFVRADGVIHHIAADTVPFSLAVVSSRGPVRFVFEIPGGTAARLGIAPGDRVEHALVPAK